MLDGILGRGGFSTKCKSLIKLTKTRIDVIRRKRNATQKFLKKDVADLLSNGLDINAYGRAEGLLLEVILSSCYDFVELCCDLVLKHLSVMQKQRECPEDCRAAVASLMFAAARFSDLPELRDLRQTFHERFGDSLALYEDEEFKENLASKPSTSENKIRLMKEIALEFSIKWDSKAFEQRMNKPSIPQERPKTHRVFHVGDDQSKPSHGKDKVLKGDVHGTVFKERFDHNDGPRKLRNENDGVISKMDAVDFQTRQGLSDNGHNKSLNGCEEAAIKKDNHDNSIRGRQEIVADRHAQAAINAKEDAIPRSVRTSNSSQRKAVEPADVEVEPKLRHHRENHVPRMERREVENQIKPDLARPYVKSNGKEKLADDNHHGQQIGAADSSSKGEVAQKVKSYKNMAIPPPYVKRYDKSKMQKHVAHSSNDGLDRTDMSKDVSTHDRANVGQMPEGVHRGHEHSRHERNHPRPERDSHNHDNAGQMPEGVLRGHEHSSRERNHARPERNDFHYHDKDKDQIYHDDAAIANPIPKPRSSRRRHSRSRSFHLDATHFEEPATDLARKSRSKRRDDSRRGLQVLFDDEHHQKDEEERIIDKLLLHYSKKSSAYEPGKPRRKHKSRHAHPIIDEVGESARIGNRDGSDKESTTPARSVSLPREHSGPSSATKVFARAATFQDRTDEARHVHPKLPDYDELAARFAALRGR